MFARWIVFQAGFVWFMTISGASLEAKELPPFELSENDRVVFLGNSFFERAIDSGHLETRLSLQWPQRKIQFRNLGWDGDTVYGHSRAGGRRRAVFGDAEEGFARMVEHVRSWKPTVIFVAYGFNESFDGVDAKVRFHEGLTRLVRELSAPSTRFVFISPLAMEAQEPAVPFGYVATRNRILGEYRDVLAAFARNGPHYYVDLLSESLGHDLPLTNNGLLVTDAGYRTIAKMVCDSLGLSLDGATASEASEAVRHAIVHKNQLYFHRWRPRNDAFVYGERKDEQQTAQMEPAQFEPHIAEAEGTIRELLDVVGGAK